MDSWVFVDGIPKKCKIIAYDTSYSNGEKPVVKFENGSVLIETDIFVYNTQQALIRANWKLVELTRVINDLEKEVNHVNVQ